MTINDVVPQQSCNTRIRSRDARVSMAQIRKYKGIPHVLHSGTEFTVI